MPRAEKAGFPTYWTSYGQGPRAALMIHCALADSANWGPLARDLSGALTMTAFDMPGHGRSARWDRRGEVQGVTAGIAADFLGGPTDIIGHSFGATVALRLAVERPELVRSLVLIEPVFFAVARHVTPDTFAAQAAHDAAQSAALRAGEAHRAARAFTETWGDGTPWDDLPESRREQLAEQMHLVEAGADAIYGDAGGMLAPGVLEGTRAPVLIVEGSASPAIIEAVCEGLAARLPRAERAVIMGAAHMAPVTHAPQVAAEILRFLSLI